MKAIKTAIQVIAGAAKTPEYGPAAVKALMKRLDMNERAFGLLVNVAPRTVRMWITGAAKPCGLARRLMQIYDAGPEVVGKLIAGAEDSQ
jgi:putative transcriptional regulator